jgi:hypothetical protein
MNRGTKLQDGLKKTLTKLYSLRDSCWGAIVFQRHLPDFEWFEAAAGICDEAMDGIKEAGRFLANLEWDTDCTDKTDARCLGTGFASFTSLNSPDYLTGAKHTAPTDFELMVLQGIA